MFILDSVNAVPMTRELAIQMAGLQRVPGERKVSNQRTSHLMGEIDQGVLTTFRWVTAQIKGQAGVYRINGQHTSRIFASRRDPVGTVVLEHYVCDTLEDVVSLWSRFDPIVSSRSKKDIFDTTFKSDPDLANLPVQQLHAAAKAVAIVELGFGYTNKASSYAKAQAALKEKQFLIWACSNFTPTGHCLRVGCFVAALQTYRDAKEPAETFWREVQEGTNPDPASGSRSLQRVLLEYSANLGKGARTGKKTLLWDQTAELCLSAWHSWRQGRPVQSLRLSKQGLARFMSLTVANSSSNDPRSTP
jgi:hypothetical protein